MPRIVPSRRTSRRSGAAVSRSRPARQGYESRPSAARTCARVGSIVVHARAVAGSGAGRAPVTTSTTRAPGSISPRRSASTSAPSAAPPAQSASTPVVSESSVGVRRDLRPRRPRRSAPPVARAAPSARSPCDGSPTASDGDVGRRLDARDAAVVGERVRDRARAERLRRRTAAAPARRRDRRASARRSPARASRRACRSRRGRRPRRAARQSSCSAISNEIVFAPSLAYGWRLPLTKPHGKSAPSSSSSRRQSS